MQDYVGALALSPCARFAAVGAADGGLTILDATQSGSAMAKVYLDAPIRCVQLYKFSCLGPCAYWNLHILYTNYVAHT